MSKNESKQFKKQRKKVIKQNKKTLKQEQKENKPKKGQHNAFYWARYGLLATGLIFFGWAVYYYVIAIQWTIYAGTPPSGEGDWGDLFGIIGWAGYGPGVMVTLWGYAIALTIIGLACVLVSQLYCKKRAW
jgi:hypothetical protein